MSDILKIVFVIIGTFIGAGFASGQEMYTFFYVYGKNGLYGIFIASMLIGCIIYKTFKIISRNNVRTYKEFLDSTFDLKNEKLARILKISINIIINMFILITYFIMIAGFGAYLNQEFGINQIFGSLILGIITFFVGISKKDSIIKINQYIIPFLIMLIVFIASLTVMSIDMDTMRNSIPESKSGYIRTSIIYSSYNMILLIPILIALGSKIGREEQIKRISIYSSLIILVLAYAIFVILTQINVDIAGIEMPAVYAVGMRSNILKYIYGIMLLFAIFTTSISLQTSFLQNLIKDKRGTKRVVFLMSIFGVALSRVGFANLVNYLYQVLGYLGLIQVYRVCITKV